jgi:pimeloyl-ACP methyl ester carboxylesterase
VFTPTLTGVGERSHLLSRDVDLETHVADVTNLLKWEELSDVVLCGHSYGGAVVTAVADRMVERLRALVYLDAFVPEDGENVLQHIPEEQAAGMAEAIDRVGDGWKIPPLPAAFFLVNERDRAWVDRQCTMHPAATFQQRLRLTGGIDRVPRVEYVRCEGFDEGSPFPPFLARARAKGWQTHTLPCGHDAMLDLPEEVVAILKECA